MNYFNNILVVFNGQTDNQALVDQSVELAKTNKATITVIDVIEKQSEKKPRVVEDSENVDSQFSGVEFIEEFPGSENDTEYTKSGIGENADILVGGNRFDVQEFILQEEENDFERFISIIRAAGISVKSKKAIGISFIEIIREVMKNNHDLVMLSAEGGDGLSDSLFGNITMHLIRKCPCPVWVIKPGQQRPIKRILAAVDLAEDDIERFEMAQKIIELSTSLAQPGNSELVVFHAWSLFGESVLRGRGGISEFEIGRLLVETQAAHRQWLKELLKKIQIGNTKIQVFLLKGNAGELIPQLTKAKEIDLVVMGTVSRGGIAGFLIGNTAEKILPKINCSIITTKPAGFITPVKLD